MANTYTARKLSARYPVDLPAWKKLREHYRVDMRESDLRTLFANSKNREEKFSLEAGDLTLDYSRSHLKKSTSKMLAQLARQADVPAAIEAMFSGEKINKTEDRSALHVALRAKIADSVAHNTPGIIDVWKVLTKMEDFVNNIHSGVIRGSTGKKLRDIVNIGIGGSDLGPVMASKALRSYWKKGMRFHSVSNIDGTQLEDLKKELDIESTIFVICSKTFTTQETMTNAKAARAWVVNCMDEVAVQYHFVAVSTNQEGMDDFGIRTDFRFGLWDWVGGRYSMWSAVGLSLALIVGMEVFKAICSGGRRMDQHFCSAAMEENMPVLLALIGIWYNNFFGAESQVILPYTNRLERFPSYLQQLQMESSGKSVRVDGKPVRCDTGMIIWGEAGNNAQHSFMQLLHQGTRFIPVDFILPASSSLATGNCRAQAEALMHGTTDNNLEAYCIHEGNRPSNTIHFDELTPEVLGQLIALYEHKVFVEGVIWGIDSFDQWGVELGKKLAQDYLT
ncbi:MAG: glucose-6-phosphate isomerase [Woeseiaceae bacterium]|nr:glucose-6-phosphate isomerase [Woeseiaceae bacterium]